MLYIDLCEREFEKSKEDREVLSFVALLVGVNEKENKMRSEFLFRPNTNCHDLKKNLSPSSFHPTPNKIGAGAESRSLKLCENGNVYWNWNRVVKGESFMCQAEKWNEKS